MQSAVAEGVGAMAAILGLEDERVIELCKDFQAEGVLEAVNFNSPGQVVIAGNKASVEKACEVMKSAGAKRAVMLPVSVPSHCSLMKPAAEKFKEAIDKVDFSNGQFPVVHNVNAQVADDALSIKEKLLTQLYQPVLWTKSMRKINSLGASMLIESGPGKVLTGLNKRIDKTLGAKAMIDLSSIDEILKEL
jgi:[acyl-carrier-protein] S-malonyltransferase